MSFIHEDFMLNGKTAVRLYHDFAESMPIIDYHCHLPVTEIEDNISFRSASHIWLGGDHYKWRVLRTNGVIEDEITGGADDFLKFTRWAETVPYTIGNPVYHWTHLELKRIFGIDELLSPETAQEIWDRINEQLKTPEFSSQGIIQRCNVKIICTTDDPADDLSHHRNLAADKEFSTTVVPAFRPDKALKPESELFIPWLSKLEESSGISVNCFEDFLKALESRIDDFHSAGCRTSDHALDTVVFEAADEKQAVEIFQRGLENKEISPLDSAKFKTWMMLWLGSEYSKRGWVMQLHIGALRSNNSRMHALLGPDTGFDSINDEPCAQALAKLLDGIDSAGGLPKTILYCLNPADNEIIATMLGNFQGGGIPGKIQFGSGWWFNDQKDGMLRQMTALSNLGLLSRFVGMLTDSRSFLSYPRHEYFRRILCSLIGKWVDDGEYPCDWKILEEIVRGICYNNAERYFEIPQKEL